jgi:6-phosphogluconolactonase
VAELVVTGDVAGRAVETFLEAAPRVIALAGGRTPRHFYDRLATIDYPWDAVDVLFTDERCVAPDHPDSNVGMIQRHLISLLSPAPRVHAMPGARCDADGHELALRRDFGALPLDLAVLGLGEDGHTASLFPGDPALEERIRWVTRVERPDHPRITLTLPALSNARLAVFLVIGESKRPALRKLLDGDASIPAARIRSDRVLVIGDPAAAG